MDNINVVIRVRPLLTAEKSKSTVQWETEENTIYQIDERLKSYNFNRVFGLDTINEKIFEEVARPILDAVMQGYNGSIFAYGQTASGKTHTMMGSERNPGLIPRMINSIFDEIENTPDRGFLLRVSYTEIYNERVYDLLSSNRKSLTIREDTNGETFVENLKIEVVSSMADIMTHMRIGEKNRTYGATSMNPNSSRSHAIFRIIIESGILSNKDGDSEIISSTDLSSGDADLIVSHLNLVDLAGSERTGQMVSGAGKFREGCSINTSLLALRNVISRLSQNTEGSFINYRDSKLTRILQSSLGGNAKTSIICTVNPSMVDETHSTLKFASMAKCIRNAPTKNVFVSEAVLLKQYAREIADLQLKLQTHSKESLDQEMMKQQLEETELKNKELEEKIAKLKDSVITSSVVNSANQRLRRETWGGFEDFNFVPPSTPQKSFADLKLYHSSCSIRTLPSQFGLDLFQSTGKEVACQAQITTDLEKKLKYRIRVFEVQAKYESEKLATIEEQHRLMEKDHKDQIEFLELEYREIENENRNLNLDNVLLKKQIGELSDKTNFLTPVKIDFNCTEFNESLGLIPNIEKQQDGMLLPWSDNEMLDKLSKLEADLKVQLQRASAAEDEYGKLQESSANYRRKTEKTFDDLSKESEAVKNSVLKLQAELEKNIKDRHTEKQEWKIKLYESVKKSDELGNLVEKMSMGVNDKEDEILLLKEQIEILGKNNVLVPEHEALKKQLKESEKEMENLRKSLKIHEEKINELQTNLKTNDEWKIKFQESQTKSDELENLAEKLSMRLADKEDEMQLFKEQIEVLENSNALIAENEELRKRLKESEKELENLRKSLKIQETYDSTMELKRCNEELEKCKVELSESNLEIKTLREKLVESAENNDQLEKQLKEIENQLKKLNLESEVKIRELEAISAALDAEKNTSQLLTKELESFKLIMDQNCQLMNQKSHSATLEIEEKQNLKIRVKTLENEKCLFEDEIGHLNARFDEKLNLIDILKEQLDANKVLVQKKEEEIENYKTSYSNLSKEHENCLEHKNEMSNYQEKVQKIKNLEEIISCLEDDVQWHKDGYQLLENELVACKQKLSDSQNNEGFSNALAEKEETINKLKMELNALKTKTEEDRQIYIKKVKEFSDKFVEYQEDSKSYEFKNSLLTNTKNNLQEEISRLKEQLRRCQSSMNSTVLTPEDQNSVGKKWDGTCVTGSGTAATFQLETIKRENERLKKKLLLGCPRCQHLRKVIRSKTQEQENTPEADKTPPNAQDESDDEDTTNWSPLKPMVTWAKTPSLASSRLGKVTESPWSTISQAFKEKAKLKEKNENLGMSPNLFPNRFNRSPIKKVNVGLQPFDDNTFVDEKNCKVQ